MKLKWTELNKYPPILSIGASVNQPPGIYNSESPSAASVNQSSGIYNSESVISNSSVEQPLDIEVHRSESELPDEGHDVQQIESEQISLSASCVFETTIRYYFQG